MMVTVAALLLLPALSQSPSSRTVSLVLPHELRKGEVAWLLVTVGVIPKGAEIAITIADGRLIGTISPHGIRPGREAGTYTIPVPADAIVGRKLTVMLSLHWNSAERAPTKKEVKRVRVKVTKAER